MDKLYRTLKRMIERGQTEGLQEKIDFFKEHGNISEENHEELIAMLNSDHNSDNEIAPEGSAE